MKTLTTGIASCVLLLPSVGCRRPSADLALPGSDGAEPVENSAGPCKPCATPKPPPGSPDDHEPPVLLGARFVSRDRVQLTFSEPIASVEGVNPRQFRLSHASNTTDVAHGYAGADKTYGSAYYYDLSGTSEYEPQTVFVELELYADQPTVLALTLSKPITPDLCQSLADTRAANAAAAAEPEATARSQVGLFLHYTSRGSIGIRDKVENPLVEFGADWALNFGSRNKTMYGSDPVARLDLLPELACPADMAATSGPPGPI